MMNDDNDGEIIFRDHGDLKLPDICLTGEEKPRKNLTHEDYPDRGSNPGPLLTGAYATACSTSMNCVKITKIITF